MADKMALLHEIVIVTIINVRDRGIVILVRFNSVAVCMLMPLPCAWRVQLITDVTLILGTI